MPKFQLVLQWPSTDVADFDDLIDFEDTLDARLSPHLGIVDGHDAGSGEINIFILTDTPEKTFAECRSLIRSPRLASGLSAAYRSVAAEEYTRLWPEASLAAFRVN